MAFYCRDVAGHTSIDVTIEAESNHDEFAQSACLRIDFEPAALDVFLAELLQLELELTGSASLRT